jgi:hypothetical protein
MVKHLPAKVYYLIYSGFILDLFWIYYYTPESSGPGFSYVIIKCEIFKDGTQPRIFPMVLATPRAIPSTSISSFSFGPVSYDIEVRDWGIVARVRARGCPVYGPGIMIGLDEQDFIFFAGEDLF